MAIKIASLFAEIGADTKNLEKGLQDSKGKIEGVGGAFNSLKSTIVPAMAAATAAVVLFKKGIEFAKEGAALQRVEESSASLASSMGLDMDEILVAVRTASKGMVSDTDIMASASRALLLGVGGNAEAMGKLMEVAAVRGRAMGLSTTQAFNDIVTGIGRNSRQILDNLGIVLDLDDAYEKYSKELGKNADQLTETEKKQAMMNAVIEDTVPLLEETGGLIVDNAGKWEQLGAAMKNVTDEKKKALSDSELLNDVLDDGITVLQGASAATIQHAEDMEYLNKALEVGIINQGNFWALKGKHARWTESTSESIDYVIDKVKELEASYALSSDELKFVNQDIGYYNDLAERAGVVTGDYAEEMVGLEGVTLDASLAMQNYTESLLFKIASEGLSSEAALSLAKSMGLVDDNTMFAATQTELLRQRYDEGIITAEQYETAIANLADELDRIQSKSVTIDITTIRREIDELKRVGRDGVQAFTKASGGLIRGAAAGAMIGAPTLVGERGPEVAFMPEGTRIISHHDAMKSLGGGGVEKKYYITANYKYESPLSLMEDIRLREAAGV